MSDSALTDQVRFGAPVPQAGKPIMQADAQIAAVARSRGASLATRNVEDFKGCGIEVINPWTAS